MSELTDPTPAPEHQHVVLSADGLPQHLVDEKQLLLLMEDWRKGRATRNLRQAISDAYVAAFTFVMLAAMLISVIIKAQGIASECASGTCQAARGLLPWSALAAALAFTLAASRMFGPVLASAAEGFWLMDAPISRAKVLVRRLWLAIGVALGMGLAVGALVAALTGSSPLAIVGWALAAGLGAAGLTAFAAAEQGAERTLAVQIVQWIVSLAGLATLMMVVGTAAGWFTLSVTDQLGEELAFAVAGFGLVLMIGAGVIARSRLNRIRRARLTSGGSLVSGMQGAMFALDFGLVRDILVERDAVNRGHVRPTRGVGYGLRALVMRDVQRLWRFPKPFFLLAASVIVPYAIQALGLRALNPSISALVLMGALIPFFASLRVLSRTGGLARCLPFSTAQIRTAASIVPGVLALVWAIAAAPAFIGIGSSTPHRAPIEGTLFSIAAGLAGFVGAVRWVSAKSADYSSPMISTGFGAMPPGLMFNLIRGFDMVALITFPLVLGWSPWLSLTFGSVAFAILRMGKLNSDELQAMQEEQKKLVEEQKAAARGDKIKVTRGR